MSVDDRPSDATQPTQHATQLREVLDTIDAVARSTEFENAEACLRDVEVVLSDVADVLEEHDAPADVGDELQAKLGGL